MNINCGDSTIEAELADTFWKRLLGLSFSKNKNMLFPMPFEGEWTFWMFGVRHPLTIVFIDKNKIVNSVWKALPLSLNPRTWRNYVSEKTCKYVLELSCGVEPKINDHLTW